MRHKPDDLLPTIAVAKMKRVERQTVAKACRDRSLPSLRIGRSYVVRRADAVAWKPRPVGWTKGRSRV